MASKITVAKEVNSFGQQVFVFGLPNGRTLRLEFCPHVIDPDGDACAAVTSLRDQNGARLPIAVNSLEGPETQVMEVANLWFSTDEEGERHGQMLRDELNALKEELAPVIESLEAGRRAKDN